MSIKEKRNVPFFAMLIHPPGNLWSEAGMHFAGSQNRQYTPRRSLRDKSYVIVSDIRATAE